MRVVVGVVVLGVLLVSGCGGGESGPPSGGESSVVSTPSCTPGTVACSAEEAETQRLQAEFIDAYWIYQREDDRLLAAGGVDEPTPELLQTTADPFLGEQMEYFRGWKAQGMVTRGETKASIALKPGARAEGSDPRLTAEICQDARESVTTLPDGTELRDGRVVRSTIYGKVIDGRAKIIYADGEVVESCA